MKRRGGLGWLPRAVTDEERYVRNMDVRKQVVYDIGAFEGLFTLRFARDANRVITFEPHPWCQQRVLDNVKLNGFTNVSIVPVALGAEASLLTLHSPKGEPARSTISEQHAAVVASNGYNLAHIPVLCWPLDSAVDALKLPPPDLIKIDAEGAEMDILRGGKRTISTHRPRLYIELHGTRDAVTEILTSYGYQAEPVDDNHILAVFRNAAARVDGSS
jgi:FkbM family methyltransferase